MNIFETPEIETLKILTPMIESMHTGWSENDYPKFSEYFSNSFKAAVDLENFNQKRKTVFTTLGKHKKIEFITFHKNPKDIIVVCKIHCEKRSAPALGIHYFIQNGPNIEFNGATINY